MNKFILELSKGIEQLVVEKGLDKEVLIKQAIDMIEKNRRK